LRRVAAIEFQALLPVMPPLKHSLLMIMISGESDNTKLIPEIFSIQNTDKAVAFSK